MAAKKYWTCPCGTRNERIKQKCPTCRRARPKKRVPVHARTLRDDSYTTYREINQAIHGPAFNGEWQPDDCGVCGKPAMSARHNDRDHDHLTGLPRGLACPGNRGCNALMPSWLTAERAEGIAAYLRRVEAYWGAEAVKLLPCECHGDEFVAYCPRHTPLPGETC